MRKSFVIMIAAFALIGLSATISNAQTAANSGPGISKTTYVEQYEPVLSPVHCTHHPRLNHAQLFTGWEYFQKPVTVNVSNQELNAQGYYMTQPAPVTPMPNVGDEMPWNQLWFWLVVLTASLLFFTGVVAVLRFMRRPIPMPTPTPARAGDTHHHYYGDAPVPIEFGPKEPSFDASDVNSIIAEIKKGKRSGRFYYRHGHESMYIKMDTPGEGATDVQPAATQAPVANAGAAEKTNASVG